MGRAIAWVAIAALALCGRIFDNDLLRDAGLLLLLAILAWNAPKNLCIALASLVIVAAGLMIAGCAQIVFDSIPVLICAIVGWLFARTLIRDRTPLIARAIKAVDGDAPLDDPQIATYARRLTAIWAIYQFALAIVAALLALHAWNSLAPNAALPSPGQFGVIGLPIAVAALFIGEFFARPFLLPQAPRLPFFQFLYRLARAWPTLIGDG